MNLQIRTAISRRQFVRATCLASATALACWQLPAHAEDNSVVFNLEPSGKYPRNSEGAFVTLNSGRILFFYTQFYGGGADESPARIVRTQSDDGGRTWSGEPVAVVENGQGANVMSVSHDGGETWLRRKLLEKDSEGWYCYTAIHFTVDAVLLAYCAGDVRVGGLNRLRLRRVSLQSLKADVL
jgi:hypothetical protein